MADKTFEENMTRLEEIVIQGVYSPAIVFIYE